MATVEALKERKDIELMKTVLKEGNIRYYLLFIIGCNTEIGKDGIGLSGGQRQRIAISRIYLKNPRIIIFDEATSALDGETEEQIHETWKNVLLGRTTIVIAHRQSSVMLCDRVAILEDGKLIETGTPTNMLHNSEMFKALFAVKGEKEHV